MHVHEHCLLWPQLDEKQSLCSSPVRISRRQGMKYEHTPGVKTELLITRERSVSLERRLVHACSPHVCDGNQQTNTMALEEIW